MVSKQAEKRSYTVIFEPQPQGGYSVTVPALLECDAHGRTLEEARAAAKHAIEGCLATLQGDREPIPQDVEAKPVFEKLALTVRGQNLRYTVVFAPAAEGGYVVTVPGLGGCVTQGETLEEARAMAKDAMECHLESLLDDGIPIPGDLKAKPVFAKLNFALPAKDPVKELTGSLPIADVKLIDAIIESEDIYGGE